MCPLSKICQNRILAQKLEYNLTRVEDPTWWFDELYRVALQWNPITLQPISIMRFTTSILLAASLAGSALAHNIQLAAHGRECFHESLHKDDKMTVTFQVGDREFGSAGNLDVDFWASHSSIFTAGHRSNTAVDSRSKWRLWDTSKISFKRRSLIHSPPWWQIHVLL